MANGAGYRARVSPIILVTFLVPPELFSGIWDYTSRPTHDRPVALRQTDRLPRKGKKGRRDDLARLLFHFLFAVSSQGNSSSPLGWALPKY
jgi:hypothetical protein